jgi:hypothetical protein
MATQKERAAVNELQEAWEEFQVHLSRMQEAGQHFARTARRIEGGDNMAARFESYFLNGITNFREGFMVQVSEANICEEVEDFVATVLEEELEEEE